MEQATTGLRERREELVRDHMESENQHRFDVTLDTFDHPRYELIATGEVFDGAGGGVRVLPAHAQRLPGPAQREHGVPPRRRRRDRRVRPARHPRGRAARHRAHRPEFRCRMCAFFLFAPGGDRIVCERVYFDRPRSRSSSSAMARRRRGKHERSRRLGRTGVRGPGRLGTRRPPPRGRAERTSTRRWRRRRTAPPRSRPPSRRE